MFTQQSSKPAQPGLFVEESPDWQDETGETKRKIREHDWVVGLLYAACDIVCWIALYGFVSYIRRDAFFTGPFEFFLVDLITVGVVLQALYIIGGYNRNTET